MKKKKAPSLAAYFPLCRRDSLVAFACFAGVTGLCFLLRLVDQSTDYVSMLYILAVFLVSRFTSGYFYGTVTSVISVLAVNYFFTYPYFNFDFSPSGYPLTFCCMMAVTIITGTLTTQIKQQSRAYLEAEREKTRSNLLRAISHDLRTPLTSIIGASSAIMENDDALSPKERKELLTGINEEAQWLIRMVENLLSITRIDDEHCKTKIHKDSEAAEEIVSESVYKFKKRFPDAEITVKVPGELLMIPMDAMLIEQVIVNLLENAVLHAKGASIIQLMVTEAAGYAVFEVGDNGCGIDKELLPHIFDTRCKPGDEDRGDGGRSMGIGLTVCNTIINAHGGAMTARNKLMGGAVFRFTLPLED